MAPHRFPARPPARHFGHERGNAREQATLAAAMDGHGSASPAPLSLEGFASMPPSPCRRLSRPPLVRDGRAGPRARQYRPQSCTAVKPDARRRRDATRGHARGDTARSEHRSDYQRRRSLDIDFLPRLITVDIIYSLIIACTADSKHTPRRLDSNIDLASAAVVAEGDMARRHDKPSSPRRCTPRDIRCAAVARSALCYHLYLFDTRGAAKSAPFRWRSISSIGCAITGRYDFATHWPRRASATAVAGHARSLSPFTLLLKDISPYASPPRQTLILRAHSHECRLYSASATQQPSAADCHGPQLELAFIDSQLFRRGRCPCESTSARRLTHVAVHYDDIADGPSS